MRICSLLPSATEIVYALGLGNELVAVTHECDEPADARTKPVITRSAIDPATLTSAQIDALVTEHLHDHRGIYHLDRDLLERLNPDLILTQELCDVCAVAQPEVERAVRTLGTAPRVLSLEPNTLGDVLETIRVVGAATGRDAEAAALVVLAIGFFVNTLFISNYLRPKLAAERSRVLNFYWMFVGLVTGVYTFGIAGILLGPILIGLLKAVVDTVTTSGWRVVDPEGPEGDEEAPDPSEVMP